jgi:hypothetical protein
MAATEFHTRPSGLSAGRLPFPARDSIAGKRFQSARCDTISHKVSDIRISVVSSKSGSGAVPRAVPHSTSANSPTFAIDLDRALT